ncbi:hypothetical protein BD626DRAFT_396510 [Schizophyllum amplum]|uniref:Uncharacterized protein n=1 Tax=Schizophyllum amplum TaxID=97359 RepID=A0A550CP63_9AGAR|nr:hypothetical protein BD626DRAFT_396510 [Auriculariopsis ampla]
MQIVSYIDSVFNAAVDDPEDWWVYLLVHTFELLLPFFMAKAIYRWELGWREGARWVPTVRRSPATHKERASARADVREMDDRATFMVLFVGLLFGIIVRDHALLPALHPAPDEANALRYRAINFAFGYAMNALWWAGQCRQILLRRRAQRFAGQYRASAVFFCLATWSEFVGHLTSVVGHYDARPAYLLAQVPSLAIAGWAASQAFTLPPEKGDDADEDEE